MGTHEFNNDSDQRTRKQVHKDTLMARAEGDFELERQGRHAAQARVIGTGARAYPPIPSGPWSADYAQVPPEEPIGIDVSETPIVGEYGEVQASLGESSALLSAAEPTPPHSPAPWLGARLRGPRSSCRVLLWSPTNSQTEMANATGEDFKR